MKSTDNSSFDGIHLRCEDISNLQTWNNSFRIRIRIQYYRYIAASSPLFSQTALARKMPQATKPIVTPTNSNPISAIKHRRAHFNSTIRRLSMIFCRSAVVFSGNQAGNPASSDGGGRRGEIRNIAPRIQKGGKTTKRLVYRLELSRQDLRNPNLKRYIASVMGSVSRQVYSGGST